MTTDGTTITGIDLFGYLTGDAARAIAFYRDGSTFGVWKFDEGGKTSGATAMFAVGDINAAVAKFRERGATLSDPIESPVCFMSFGEDPDGNGIVIHHRKVKD
jgi:predicted enzyme related to lactoylglutathione lyase